MSFTPWSISTDELAAHLKTDSRSGLTTAEARKRLDEYGPNLLPEKGPAPLWLIVLRQFVNPLIYILVAAAAVSVLIGDIKDASFIAVVLFINAVIGAYQEAQAERSSHALRKLLRMHAQVERDGEVREIMADEVVPGDVVWLESGNRVAADLRLLLTQGVEIDESLLTGESMAVTKNAEWKGDNDVTLADRQNMAFAGSMVARGRAKGIVVATGSETHVGQLALDVMGSGGGNPPLLARMERFTNHVAIGTIVASVLIGVTGYVVWNYTPVETFFLVVALAVAAIPEGLPVAMTVALAVATSRMAKRNVIVRRLTAVEGLGSCTLIATDKTGTLTCNELTVREVRLSGGAVYHVTGEGFSPRGEVLFQGATVDHTTDVLLTNTIRAAVLCNEADLHHADGDWVWRGDAVDVAILSVGQKLGLSRESQLDSAPQVNQIPFESERQYSASYHRRGDGTDVFVKGAPERVLEMCATKLSADDRSRLESAALDMAKRGLRVIAVAGGFISPPIASSDTPAHPHDLDLLGFLGMIDPLRPGAREAVADCHSAGVEVTMVTGDHRVTALAIARDLGLAERDDQVMTAVELVGKSDDELADVVGRVRVFARVTPRQKLEIVNAARKAGHYVAVTGDGVNDAPALRAANIGVAMGKAGTDVAREAAELVISDDNFSSIVGGIEEGRIAYDNIRKVIFLLVSMGAAELVMVLLSVITGLPVPLLPVQLLWLNLVTNGIQGVALAFEPGEGDSLKRKPRPPGEPVFNRLMIERIAVSVFVVGVGGFLVYAIAMWLKWDIADARNLLLLVMVLFENFHVGNCRSETKSALALSPLRSPVLFFGTLGAFLVHVAGMYIPFLQGLLATRPIDPWMWAVAIGVSVLVVPAIELHKWYSARQTADFVG
ncbi:MAG: HAD-IC family P-type ATPase [Planctomycetota bacterium]|nr:HAD-IC family P-type ATPase [Planctomycetota bacterium]MDA1211904.1 HAD-IC family P-type ATPase [Planctomycetota bacterium]